MHSAGTEAPANSCKELRRACLVLSIAFIAPLTVIGFVADTPANAQTIKNKQAPANTSRLSSTKKRSKAPCGVWICTWKTSDGGCLVKEKTKCKVIDPFD